MEKARNLWNLSTFAGFSSTESRRVTQARVWDGIAAGSVPVPPFSLTRFAWDDSNRRLPLHCTNWQRHLPLDRENLGCGKIHLFILLTIARLNYTALTSSPHLSRASKSLTSHFLHLFSFTDWKAPAAPKIRNSRKRKSSLKCFSLNSRCCPDGVGVEFILERRVESVQTATAKFSVLLDKKEEWNITQGV